MTQTITIDNGSLVVDDLSPSSAIQSVTAGTSGAPGTVTRGSAWTVVLVSGTYRVQLDTSFQTNDRVEFLVPDGSGVAVQTSSGSEYFIQSGSTVYAIAIPASVRKISSYQWVSTP